MTTLSSTVTSNACVRAELGHERVVEGLDEAHVDDGRVELIARLERRREHRAESENRDASPFAPDFGLADRQRAHLSFHRSARARTARITHRRGLIEEKAGVEHLAAFVLVGWRHHDDIRHAPQVRKVERP